MEVLLLSLAYSVKEHGLTWKEYLTRVNKLLQYLEVSARGPVTLGRSQWSDLRKFAV